MRTAFAILCSCVLLTFSVVIESAKAGDYYDGGYRVRRSANVWYSSDCCYKKVVRHIRQVRYVHTEPYRHHGYYDRPRYRESYYAPPPRYYSERYPAHYSTVYVEPARRRYTDYYAPRYTSYRGYDAYNAAQCYSRRVPVADGRGGWVWGFRQVCN
jgi:hypothetical protein